VVNPTAQLIAGGVINNPGSIVLQSYDNPPGGIAQGLLMTIAGNVSLQGGGQLTLAAPYADEINTTAVPVTLENVDNTIAGASTMLEAPSRLPPAHCSSRPARSPIRASFGQRTARLAQISRSCRRRSPTSLAEHLAAARTRRISIRGF
jgi:hypothetical protein